jgi:hypothetical protein
VLYLFSIALEAEGIPNPATNCANEAIKHDFLKAIPKALPLCNFRRGGPKEEKSVRPFPG